MKRAARIAWSRLCIFVAACMVFATSWAQFAVETVYDLEEGSLYPVVSLKTFDAEGTFVDDLLDDFLNWDVNIEVRTFVGTDHDFAKTVSGFSVVLVVPSGRDDLSFYFGGSWITDGWGAQLDGNAGLTFGIRYGT